MKGWGEQPFLFMKGREENLCRVMIWSVREGLRELQGMVAGERCGGGEACFWRGALRGESPRTREGRRPDRPDGRSPWRRLRSGDRQP